MNDGKTEHVIARADAELAIERVVTALTKRRKLDFDRIQTEQKVLPEHALVVQPLQLAEALHPHRLQEFGEDVAALVQINPELRQEPLLYGRHEAHGQEHEVSRHLEFGAGDGLERCVDMRAVQPRDPAAHA